MVSPSFAQFSGLPPERQGSLSQEQQMELYDMLENEGMTDIDTYLSMGNMNGITSTGTGVGTGSNGGMSYTNGGTGVTSGNTVVNPNAQVNWGGRS